MPRLAFRLLVGSLLGVLPLAVQAAPLRVMLPPQTIARGESADDQAWAMLRDVTPGTRLVVGRPMGAVAGSFEAVDTESITLKDAGYEGPRVVIPRREVTTVLGAPHRNVGPHLARGVSIGAAVGMLIGASVGQKLNDSSGALVVSIGALGGGMGLAVGALNGLGANPTSDVLYRRVGTVRP